MSTPAVTLLPEASSPPLVLSADHTISCCSQAAVVEQQLATQGAFLSAAAATLEQATLELVSQQGSMPASAAILEQATPERVTLE